MNKLICALFLLFSTSVFATPVVTDSVVPQNLHVYSGNGDLYVDLVLQVVPVLVIPSLIII